MEVGVTGARREPGRTVTSKVIGVLRSFDTAEPELSLHEIVARTGLPPSTALRLIRELVDAGVLERTPVGSYCIGLDLWRTGELSMQARQLRASARTAMVELHNTLQSAVALVLHHGDEAVVVDKIGPPGSPEPFPAVAIAMPLHATASGKLLLATMPVDARRRLLAGRLRRFTPRTIVAPGLLAASVAAVERQGVATTTGEIRAGWSTLATYIRSPDGTAMASLTVGVRSSRFDPDRLAGYVRRAARSTECQLAALNSG
jgi:DNA-binding IclR family transcriptional regulator